MIAGTWVVNTVQGKLGDDLAKASVERPRRVFTEAALDLYGIYELQMLEDVLRKEATTRFSLSPLRSVAKPRLPDEGDDYLFLQDYYAALCARLEREHAGGAAAREQIRRRCTTVASASGLWSQHQDDDDDNEQQANAAAGITSPSPRYTAKSAGRR